MPLAGDAVTDTRAPAGRCGDLVGQALEREQLEDRVGEDRRDRRPAPCRQGRDDA